MLSTAERPVLSRRQEWGFEPQGADLLENETQIWTLSNTDRTDAHRFFATASILISDRLTTLRRIR